MNRRSRDNSRTPFQWNNGKNAGFSDSKPWLKVKKDIINISKCIDNYETGEFELFIHNKGKIEMFKSILIKKITLSIAIKFKLRKIFIKNIVVLCGKKHYIKV